MILKIENLYKKYDKKANNFILKNINFSLTKGRVVVLLGENGAGKTTLIKTICGILYPTKGTIYYNEEPIHKNINMYKQNIGAVLEGNRNLYWFLSPMDNFLYFGRLLNLPTKIIKERSSKLLKLFSLYEEKDKKVGFLSRGMQQKVAIIIALLNKPSILLLDEPTLGLDVISRKSLLNTISELKNSGTCIILTSHQLDIAQKIGDDLIMLRKGEILIDNNLKKLLDSESSFTTKIKFKEVITDKMIEIVKKTGFTFRKKSNIELIVNSNMKSIIDSNILEYNFIESISEYRKSLEEFFLSITNKGNIK